MRIVSLCPSLTELVFDLGRGTELVAITDYCIHPATGVRGIEKIGGTKNPNIIRIIELQPDLVLVNEEENRLADAKALARAGLLCHSSFPRNASETAAMVRSIGAVIDRQGAAEEIASQIEQRCRAVRARCAGQPPVRFAYLIWRKPWMAVNADTYAHALLTLPGGVNVFAEVPQRYPQITLPQLRHAKPEVVFLGTEPFPFRRKHIDELVSGTSIARWRFRLANGEYLAWHGSRTPAGIEYAERLIRAAAPHEPP